MPRRARLEVDPAIRKIAVELWRKGKSLDEIVETLKLSFPEAPSRSSVHRFLQKLKPFFQLKDAGLISDEDIDLLSQSQNLAAIANGLLIQVLASWYEKGELDSENLKALLSLVQTAARMSQAAAGVERTKVQLARHYEEIAEKVVRAVARAVEDEALREKIIREVRDELQA